MSSPPRAGNSGSPNASTDHNPPTYASFSPSTLGHYPSVTKQRSTILVHQKSPLLLATPPQVTRALAYSHPFILPLNKLVGLLSWTTGDPWESFLLVAAFWAVTLYGDLAVRWAGPIVLVVGLILGLYTRRYSPLSSTGWTGAKAPDGRARADSDGGTRHHKTLDEIVNALKLFTARCNILLDPLIRMTDFLSTQSTATEATTRPALTALFLRILLVTPVWIALTLPPLYVVTTRRVVLTAGTLLLSWHSRPARVSRTILWRSRLVRRLASAVTGLDFGDPNAASRRFGKAGPPLPPRPPRTANDIAASLAAKRNAEPGIRFTFTLYENQRRWIGLGWTASMLAYERANWTDEHLNSAPSKDRFTLPEVEGGYAQWQWVEGTEWRVEGASNDASGSTKGGSGRDGGGWIFYDNKWRDGRKQDGWGRYTRRRKWYRDAELVEVAQPPPSESGTTAPATPARTRGATTGSAAEAGRGDSQALSQADTVLADDAASIVSSNADAASTASARKRRGWFKKRSRSPSEMSTAGSGGGGGGGEGSRSIKEQREGERQRRQDEGEDVHSPLQLQERESDWGLGDDMRMGLG